MAIYHLNAKTIARSQGQSATAAAAYRAGEKIEDRRTGTIHDYSRKKGVYATEIITPLDAPHWTKDRAELWNQAEEVETRKNSRTAREFDIALPVELTHPAKRELVRSFVTNQFTNRNLVADIAFHHINSQNPHVHILITTRAVTEEGFQEKVRELDSKNFLISLRQAWADVTNQALEQAGSKDRIDHRTLIEQGSDHIPQIHLGANVSAMMRKGVETERGNQYLAIQSTNQQIDRIEAQKAELEGLLALETPTHESIQVPDTAKLTPKAPAHQRSEPDTPKNQTEQVGEQQILDLARTALAALERYGKKQERSKILTNATHHIQREYVFEDRAWHTYLTISNKDSQQKILTLRSNDLKVRQMSLITNNLTQQDVEIFSKIQISLDKIERIERLKRDAETVLQSFGTRSGNYTNRSIQLKLDRYEVISDRKSLRIIASDGRSEILDYPRYAQSSYPELEAKVNFTLEDAEVFRVIANRIEEQQRQAEREQERQRHRGLER
jgi:hypothetical protein